MVYKDEYEVVWLWISSVFDVYFVQIFKGGKVNYYLVLLIFFKMDVNGYLMKWLFGLWMKIGFKILCCFKGLCGMWFDLFGWIVECKMECKLCDQYFDNMQCLLVDLFDKNIDLVVVIVEVLDDICGYGYVKEVVILEVVVCEVELWQNWFIGMFLMFKMMLIVVE